MLQSVKTAESSETYFAGRLENYEQRVERLRTQGKWLDYPSYASVETYAICNAACEFCPYPTMERKGDIMPTALFEKIITDLAAPRDKILPQITLARVNEPFLDKRIYEFLAYINEKLPKTIIDQFTNGSPLNDRNFDRFLMSKNTGFLNISFNDHRPQEYERTMKLPFERSYANVRRIHDRLVAKEFRFRVRIGRVGDGTSADQDFLCWAEKEFPLFDPYVAPRFDWMGKVAAGSFKVPNVGCAQWFQLHFLADGREAFCCIDSDASFGRGDANTENALDIYNHPNRRALREQKLSRLDVDICAKCSSLS